MFRALQDNKVKELIAQGYSGALPDMFKRYLADNNIISWDDYIQNLYDLGYTGAVPDIEYKFWEDGGLLLAYWLDELGVAWDTETTGQWAEE